MTEINDIDFEQDQQDILEKSDINTLAQYCAELKAYEDEISELQEKIAYKKERANKISEEVIPNLLAEQGLSSLKLADGSSVEVNKVYNCSVKPDELESAYKWLRDNNLGDIIKNIVSVQFGMGEDNKAEQMLNLAVQSGYEPEQKESVHHQSLKALYRERVEAGLDMPSQFFHTFVKDQTKISRK